MPRLAFGIALTLLLVGFSAHADETSAHYMLTFVPTWSAASHPLEYPAAPPRAAHFAPIIGATHRADYRLFELGKTPTPGLERLSERGKHDPLDSEIQKAIKAGKAGSLFQLDQPVLGPVHQPVSTTFVVSDEYPMVSAVLMIAPSPDWFTGASLHLKAAGHWLPTVTVVAYALDGGGDDGTTYLAEDADAQPKHSTNLATNPHFKHAGELVPVGVFVFTRIPAQ